MSKDTMVLTMKMGDVGAGPHNTLERHLDVRELPQLLAEGWVMVAATPPDAEGNAKITLERAKPDTTSQKGKDDHEPT